MPRPTVVEEETANQIVEAYRSGEKLRSIEERFGVTRSQLYWVLQKYGVAPQRTKSKSRLEDGDPMTVQRLYEIVEAQDQRIQEFEELFMMVESYMSADSTMIDDTESLTLEEKQRRRAEVLDRMGEIHRGEG